MSALAGPFDMSLPGFMKHLGVLEDAGLIEREKAGRVVTCALSPEPLRDAAAWIDYYRKFRAVRPMSVDGKRLPMTLKFAHP